MEATMPIIQDGLHQILQNDTCCICGEVVLGDGQLIVMVDSGRMVPMKRDPAFLKFASDSLNDEAQADDIFVDVLHAECLVSCVEADWGKFSPQQCDGCEARFLKDTPKWAFRFRVGSAADYSGIFVAGKDPANNAILCPDCFDFYLGAEEANWR
jgi:hypothetical protein